MKNSFYNIGSNINGLIILEEIFNHQLLRGRVFKIQCTYCASITECSSQQDIPQIIIN